MEKKKMKLWKKILIIVIILFLIFLAFTVRKMIIMYSLENKLNESRQQSNIYEKTTMDYSIAVLGNLEKYYKDGIEKNVMLSLDGTTKIIQYIYPNERKVFSEENGHKTLTISEESNGDAQTYYPMFTSYTEANSFLELLFNSITSKIVTENINGKECYVLSGKYNSNFLYGETTTNIKAYIEKETGITLQVVEFYEENGEQKQFKREYTYSFGTVTDDDMKEPDETQYELLESK